MAILGKESLDSVLVLFGAAKARAVSVGLNWRLTPEELVYILQDARVRLLFVDAESASLVPRLLERLKAPLRVVSMGRGHTGPESFSGWCEGADSTPPPFTYDAEEVVVHTPRTRSGNRCCGWGCRRPSPPPRSSRTCRCCW